MAQDTEKLRELLAQYIGGVYAEALQYTGEPAKAKEVTRRVMALLKRSQEAGLAVNPSMAKRLTADCCNELRYYDSRRAAFVNGTIADMPDFDTAISEISQDEVRAKARSDAETKAVEAHAAMRAAKAVGANVVTAKETEKPEKKPFKKPARQQPTDDLFDDLDEPDEQDNEELEDYYDELRARKRPRHEKGQKRGGFSAVVLVFMIMLLMFLLICLAVMLMKCGIIPGADSDIVRTFAIWFNGHLFPLY